MDNVISQIQLKYGQRNLLKINKLVKFEIKTKAGTIIGGYIHINDGLEILPKEDIEYINVYTTEESFEEIKVVK